MHIRSVVRVAVALVAVTMFLAGSSAGALPRRLPVGGGERIPTSGGAVTDPGTSEEADPPPGTSVRVPRPGATVDPEPDVAVGDHLPNQTSPLDVVLELEGTGPEITAHVDLIALQALTDPPSPVQVDILWGDGAGATFAVAGGRFEPLTISHVYEPEEDTTFTVFAWVTDDRGGYGIESQRTVVEAPYTVRLTDATFRPWMHDCDSWLRGQGDFKFSWSYEWRGQALSGSDEFKLDTAEPADILGTITASGATRSAHPAVVVAWNESDAPLLDVPPYPFDLPMRPDMENPDRWETVMSNHGDCQVRIDYRLVTMPA